MGWLRVALGALGIVCILWMGGCGDDSSSSGAGTMAPVASSGDRCTPGNVLVCACPTGQGMVTCDALGTVGACFCPEAAAGSGGNSNTGMPPGNGGVDNGTGGNGGNGGDGDSGSMPTVIGDGGRIPPAPATCPNLATGMVTVRGQQVRLWVGNRQDAQQGAIMFYWHGTGQQWDEINWGLGMPIIQEIIDGGGMVASFSTSTGEGYDTPGNGVWHSGDFGMADDLLACAAQQLNVDTRRIFTAGCSAGGLHSGIMMFARSSYLAGAMPNSGGVIKYFEPPFEDPAHVPSLMSVHGGAGVDVWEPTGLDFSESTADLTRDIAAAGGIVVNCDHGGLHCEVPQAVTNAQWAFLKAHPFGVSPDPYAGGLPASFPPYCRQVN